MPKKKAKSKEREFEVLKGFNVEDGRWERGDTLNEADVMPENIEALLEMDAIAEVKE